MTSINTTILEDHKEADNVYNAILPYQITQYLLNKVLKKFGQQGEEAVSKELMQLLLLKTFSPLMHPP